MYWKSIILSENRSSFAINGKPVFDRTFLDALKFHAPGLAPVCDNSGWHHINTEGTPLYLERYLRAFGYYCNRAAVITKTGWQHINEMGFLAYTHSYAWCGNFQQNLCAVRNQEKQYFHIDLNGNPVYEQRYSYAGDFKNGYACVRNNKGFFTHIDTNGEPRHGIFYRNLGVYHKGFATAKDESGWCHIDEHGQAIYKHRFGFLEPFYNGQALATTLGGKKVILNEMGDILVQL